MEATDIGLLTVQELILHCIAMGEEFVQFTVPYEGEPVVLTVAQGDAAYIVDYALDQLGVEATDD